MVCPRWRTASAIRAAHCSLGPSMISSARLSATRATISPRSTFSCPSMRSRTSSLMSQCRQSLIRSLHQARVHTLYRDSGNSSAGWRVAKCPRDAPVAAALLFDLAHEHLADFGGRAHVGAAARLNVYAAGLHDAHGVADLRRRHHGGPHQSGPGADFADRPVLHLNRHASLDDLVDPLRQCEFIESVFFEIEVDARMIGMDGTSGNR